MIHLTLEVMYILRKEFEKKLQGYMFEIRECSEFSRIYIIEDSLILLVNFVEDDMPVCLNAEEFYSSYREHPYLEFPKMGNVYYDFKVEELTYNEIGFKFNNTLFSKEMEALLNIDSIGLDISYTRFKGYERLYWCPEVETTAEYINRVMPELQLRERYEKWEGIKYKFLIIEFDALDGKTYYAVAYTTGDTQTYINKIGSEYIKHGMFYGENFRTNHVHDFWKAMNMWKGVRRQKRLEEHLRYCVLKKNIREKNDAWRYADELLQRAYEKEFDILEKSSYVRPVNKWITEEYVYKLIKKMYGDYKVIYQHRPFYLKSSIGGQMSYDVFIAGLNVAIEYQGKQHFEAIDYFGGEEAFKELQRRDEEKRILSENNGVKLVYINYWEDVTIELIRSRIEE